MKRTIQVAALIAAVLFVASCAWSPEDDTGSVTLAFSLPAASVSGSATVGTDLTKVDDADTARVSLFYAGVELPIGPDGQGFADVGDVRGGTREFKIDNLPEGDAYRISVVLASTDDQGTPDDPDDDVLLPVAYGFSNVFTITGGRETPVSVRTFQLDTVATVTYFDDLVGKDVVGAVWTNETELVAATASTLYRFSSGGGSPSVSAAPTDTEFHSISKGKNPSGTTIPFVNTSRGILPVNSSGLYTSFLQSMGGLANGSDPFVTGSGAFRIADGTIVYFYQRKGGLGGTATSSPANSDWVDAGAAVAELVDENESPVFAQATSGSNVAYLSTVLGTFQLTEQLFTGTDGIEPVDLLDPDNSTSGLTFFGVAYPNSSRPVKIRHLALADSGAGEQLIVGSPRGAFAIGVGAGALGDLQNNGLVKSTYVTTLQAALDREVVDLTSIDVGGKEIVVIVTKERLIVVDLAHPDSSLLNVPTRAFVLGNPKSIQAYAQGGALNLLVAGNKGLTRVKVEAGDL